MTKSEYIAWLATMVKWSRDMADNAMLKTNLKESMYYQSKVQAFRTALEMAEKIDEVQARMF